MKAVQANVDLRQAACLFGWKENIDGKIIFRVGSFIFQVRKIISSGPTLYFFSESGRQISKKNGVGVLIWEQLSYNSYSIINFKV